LNKKIMPRLDIATAAYIAGLLDGEGSFLLEKFATDRSPIGFQYRSQVYVGMCDYEAIKFVADATDRHIQTRIIKSGKTFYAIVWRNSFAVWLMKEILPYLKGKRAQAEILIDYEERIAVGRGRTYTREAGLLCEDARARLFAARPNNPAACRRKD
jgi:hypothetical protein